MAARLSFTARLNRKLPRVGRAVALWARAIVRGGRPETRVVFVVGSQRSGTRVPVEMLERSPDVMSYTEGTSPYFDGVLLKPLDEVERLLRRSPAPVVVLKPICETHRVCELLDRFPGSRAIWIFRDYRAAVRSASIKWTSGREAVRRLAEGDLEAAGWRAGGLTSEKLDLVRRLYSPDMSPYAANAVMWYLRNDLYFELKAADRQDILIVRYEDLAAYEEEEAHQMFAFVGVKTPVRHERVVRPHGQRPDSPLDLPSTIRELCESVFTRLCQEFGRRAAGRRHGDVQVGRPGVV